MKLCSILLLVFSLSAPVFATENVQPGAWDPDGLKTPYQVDLPVAEKVAGLSKLWSEAKFNFANFALVPDLDWDKAYLAALPRVMATKSTLEYYQVLTEFYASLHDGHTNVYYPPELQDNLARPPIRTGLIEGKVVVTEVHSPSLAAKGLRIGMEVLRIDGVNASERAAKMMPYVSASTPQDRILRTYTYTLLRGPKAQPVTLDLLDAQGKEVHYTISRGDYADVPQPLRPKFEFRILPGNIAYVALNSFEDETVADQFAAAFDKIDKSSGMIIDIRNNGGGKGNTGFKIIAQLTDKDFRTSNWITRQYVAAERAWGQPESWYFSRNQTWAVKDSRHYTKPIVLLTSAGTFSAAEDFAVAFDSIKRGAIVGEATGGSTGMPLSFTLPGGGSARVCTKHDTYPDGREFVGVGVLPQREVHPRLADLRANRDTVLEAGLDELRRVQK